MENEKIPNINKFKILTFNGRCDGSNFILLDNIKPILGKQLRIFRTIINFYNTTDTGFPYFVSKNNTLTADLYQKIKAYITLNNLQIKNDGSFYINFKINNNLVFPSTTLPFGNLDIETNFITDKINSLELKIYLYAYDGITDSLFTPSAIFKIFCEVL